MTIAAPIVQDTLRYEQRPDSPGVIFAVAAATGTVKWKAKVHTAPFELAMLDGSTLWLDTAPHGLRFALDVTTHDFELVRYPVALSLEGMPSMVDGRWHYRVTIRIENLLKDTVQLDGPSVAEGTGSLRNSLFVVTADGVSVQYHGMMAKRAKPDRFLKLKPGATYTNTVDLTEAYPLPKKTKQVEVKFEHTNHFSPDAFRLESAPVRFALGSHH